MIVFIQLYKYLSLLPHIEILINYYFKLIEK